jgi:hypothetical protein
LNNDHKCEKNEMMKRREWDLEGYSEICGGECPLFEDEIEKQRNVNAIGISRKEE